MSSPWETHPDARVRAIAERLIDRGMFSEVGTIARRHHVCFDDIASRCRTRAVVRGRRAVWHWMHHTIGYSLTEVARLWDCDHTTVMAGIRKGDNDTANT